MTASSGATARLIKVSHGSSMNMATTIARIITMSVRIVNTPNESVSPSASTSLVLRESSEPSGCLSKKRAGRRITC